MYDIPFDRLFLQLSNGMTCHAIYWQKARIKSLAAICVLTDLATPAVIRTAVYAEGLSAEQIFMMGTLQTRSLYLSCPFPLCTNNQYINKMGVYYQTQLYSLLMLLCYMF
jgi:GTP-dependent phosphoenolpyruvate carboxykinase